MSETEAAERLVFDHIARLEVDAETLDCDPSFADTAAFCEKYGYDPANSANAIIVASKKEPRSFCACLVLADTRLDVNHTVRRLLGVKRLSFASADDTIDLTGQMIGGVSVFGLPEDLPLFADSAVMERDYIIVGGGSRSKKVKVPPSELRKIPWLQVIEGLAQPIGSPSTP